MRIRLECHRMEIIKRSGYANKSEIRNNFEPYQNEKHWYIFVECDFNVNF